MPQEVPEMTIVHRTKPGQELSGPKNCSEAKAMALICTEDIRHYAKGLLAAGGISRERKEDLENSLFIIDHILRNYAS